MSTLLAVFIGGGLGSVARYGISRIVTSNFQNINPVATLVSNVISVIVLGAAIYFVNEKVSIPTPIKAMISIGFCGGFSTFSTFSYEIFELFKMGNYLYAISNILISLLLGVGVLFIMSKSI